MPKWSPTETIWVFFLRSNVKYNRYISFDRGRRDANFEGMSENQPNGNDIVWEGCKAYIIIYCRVDTTIFGNCRNFPRNI